MKVLAEVPQNGVEGGFQMWIQSFLLAIPLGQGTVLHPIQPALCVIPPESLTFQT